MYVNKLSLSVVDTPIGMIEEGRKQSAARFGQWQFFTQAGLSKRSRRIDC